jgi:hypothetical protein
MKASERGRVKIFWSRRYKMYYLQIPKSGCTTIKHQLGCKVSDWQTVDEPINDKYKILIGVREPFGRFISGYWEMKRLRQISDDTSFDHFVEMCESRGLWHDHLWHQTYYIEECITSIPLTQQYDFFVWDDDLTEKLRGILEEPDLQDIRLNKTENNIVWFTHEIMQKVRKMYKDDFTLYEKINAEIAKEKKL